MKAMLLCAGLGKRLLPLTRTVPKPIVPVLGRPIAALNLERLARYGVTTAVVNLHHLPDVVRRTLGDGAKLGLRIVYTHEERLLLGTGGGVRNAAAHLSGRDPLIVVNSDFLSDIDIRAALKAHRASGCEATLVLAERRTGYSTVDVDAAGRIRSIAGTPAIAPDTIAGRHLFTGLQILEPRVLERIPAAGPSDIVRHVHMGLAAEGRLGAFVHRGLWWEFGGCRAYLDGSLALLDLPAERLREVARTDDVRRLDGVRVAVGTGADFHNAVDLRGRVALGADSTVAEGTSVEDCVVMPGARIGPGCTLRRAIVGPHAEIPAGMELSDVLVGHDDDPDSAPPADTRRENGLLIRRIEG